MKGLIEAFLSIIFSQTVKLFSVEIVVKIVSQEKTHGGFKSVMFSEEMYVLKTQEHF